MERLFSVVDGLSAWVARLAAPAVILLMLTLVLEVIMRFGFGRPTAWTFDVSYFLNSFFVMMGAAYTLRRNAHVRVDIVYDRLPPRVRAGMDAVLMGLVFVPFLVILLNAMWPNIYNSWRTGERASTGTWLPLIYPFKAWVYFALCLLLLQGVVETVRSFLVAVRRTQ